MSEFDRRGTGYNIVAQLDAHCGDKMKDKAKNIYLDIPLPIFHSPYGCFNNCSILNNSKEANSVNFMGITYLHGETAREELIPIIKNGEAMCNVTSSIGGDEVGDSLWAFLPTRSDFEIYKPLYNNQIVHKIKKDVFIPPLTFCGSFLKKREMYEKIHEMIIKKSINDSDDKSLSPDSLDPSKLHFNLPDSKLEKLSMEDRASYYRRQMFSSARPNLQNFAQAFIQNAFNEDEDPGDEEEKNINLQEVFRNSSQIGAIYENDSYENTTELFENILDDDLVKDYEKKYFKSLMDCIMSLRIHHLGIIKKPASPGQSVLLSF